MEYNMKKYEDFIEGLQKEVEVPGEVLAKFEDTLINLPEKSTGQEHRKGKMKIWMKAAVSAAAVLALGTGFCLTNPVLAAKIPIIGKIFERVEEDVTFSGDYKEKADILTTEQDNTSEPGDTSYTVKDQGVEFTASEIYCDGYSIFLTAKIQVEAGGLNNIPAHYTNRFAGEDEKTAQTIYTDGEWNVQNENKSERLWDNNFEGKVLDDHTYIGMMKIDLEDLTKKNGIIDLQLSFLGYDDLNELDSDDISASHKIEGNWEFSLPYTVDFEDAGEITVNKKSEEGYGISKIFVSPYQLVVYTDIPYTTLSEEEFSREEFENVMGEKNKEIEAAGERPVTYEEFLNEKRYEYYDLCIFNQDGQTLTPQWTDAEKSVFAVKGLDISKLYIFMGNDLLELEKETDMNAAKEKAVLEAEIEVR